MNSVTVHARSGKTWTTSVAAAIDEQAARSYFVGQTFNVGKPTPDGEIGDHFETIERIEWRAGTTDPTNKQ